MADKPIFIKLDEYNELTDILNIIKVKVSEAKQAITNINQLKQEEEAEVEIWSRELEEVEKRMAVVESNLSAARE
ncbi:hypothetical protein GF345_03900 [Candidatus Woesearchaeota archaeon]|nr:hypothetical protein [Candidatus Woesearchaeota archaeon]